MLNNSKNVWVTGARGFIGKHLLAYLALKGYIVSGIGHGTFSEPEAKQLGVNRWLNGDISLSNLQNLCESIGRPSVIYHLAGGSSVGLSYQNPYEDFCRTVESSAQLFEWIRLYSPDTKVVCVSSAAVYGAQYNDNITENYLISPYSPYGTHKSIMEKIAQSYADNFGINVAVVRFFSIYGAGLQKQLVWDLCHKLSISMGKPVTLGGTGEELRDWLHVSDAVCLLELVGNSEKSHYTIINGGTGCATSVRNIANMVCAAWGGASSRVEFNGQSRVGDPFSLIACCEKAAKLGFAPRTDLTTGLNETVAWFKTKI